MTRPRLASLALLAVLAAVPLAGCKQMQKAETRLRSLAGPVPTAEQASQAYEAGDYATALDLGSRIADHFPDQDQPTAAYIAGVSAQKLDQPRDAERYLRQAMDTGPSHLIGSAGAQLGLLYSQQERYRDAAETLDTAARHLTGEDKAQAYFYAGVARQKLGQWPTARTSLLAARRLTTDAALKQQIESQLGVTGYTLQLGAYKERANAQEAAESMADAAIEQRLGPPLLVDGVTSAGVPVTYVRVGEFSTYMGAADARDRLGTRGAIIVPLAEMQ